MSGCCWSVSLRSVLASESKDLFSHDHEFEADINFNQNVFSMSLNIILCDGNWEMKKILLPIKANGCK